MVRVENRIRVEKLVITCLLAAASLLATGCVLTTAPLLVPETDPPGEFTAAQIRSAILQGLTDKGWSEEGEADGALLASVRSGGHTATVRVRYDASSWRIEYVRSSEGLRHDAELERIHWRYNRWVDELDAAIRRRLPLPG